MKSHTIDLLLSIFLLGLMSYHLQQEPILQDNIPLQNEKQDLFSPQDLSIIFFWAPWSKPSLRQIQIFHRFTQTHPDIQLVAVHSKEEDSNVIKKLKLEKGWYFPFVQTEEFPDQLPYTIIVRNGKREVFDNSIYYEQLLEVFSKDH